MMAQVILGDGEGVQSIKYVNMRGTSIPVGGYACEGGL
jgi:hypothetical protein